ncbi:MAG: Coat domain protein [Pelosinus sp.]|jgi:spore coat protein CotF|nr:Coat domain protein [Pelosinus sp.]
MTLKLTQKERLLLEDQKKHEQVCVEKYQAYANQAQDPALKQLFNSYSQKEQQHLNSVTQMLNGQVPTMSSQQSQQSAQSNIQNATSTSSQGGAARQSDKALCTDMLMTEKFVSGAYDTAIFEFADPNARQALNHIQKEEQEHGQGIFQYMQSNGMYNTQ